MKRSLGLVVAVTLTLAAPGAAADKPEDQAREAAVALLKAVKAKDADAVVKLADVPFLYRDGGLVAHKEADALKKWVADKVQEVGDPDKVPTTVDEVLPFAAVKDKIKAAADRALAEEVMGKDGFLAVVATSDGKKVGISVRVRDGKARVVGLIH